MYVSVLASGLYIFSLMYTSICISLVSDDHPTTHDVTFCENGYELTCPDANKNIFVQNTNFTQKWFLRKLPNCNDEARCDMGNIRNRCVQITYDCQPGKCHFMYMMQYYFSPF